MTPRPVPLPPPFPDRRPWARAGEERGQEPAQRLTHREWETKSYTGICTVFPSVISLRVLRMSSLSKASEGDQTAKTLFVSKMTSPYPRTGHPSKPVLHVWYHTLERHVLLPPKKPRFLPKAECRLRVSECVHEL